MKNKWIKYIRKLLCWEFLILFIYGFIINLWRPADMGLYSFLGIPLFTVILYKFSKNEYFKEIIKNFFQSWWQPAVFAGSALLIDFLLGFIEKVYYRIIYLKSFHSPNNWITSKYGVSNFVTCMSLMLFIIIYQLIYPDFKNLKLKGYAIINLCFFLLVFIIFILLNGILVFWK